MWNTSVGIPSLLAYINSFIVESSSVLIRGLLLSLELGFLFKSEFWTLRVDFLQQNSALETCLLVLLVLRHLCEVRDRGAEGSHALVELA